MILPRRYSMAQIVCGAHFSFQNVVIQCRLVCLNHSFTPLWFSLVTYRLCVSIHPTSMTPTNTCSRGQYRTVLMPHMIAPSLLGYVMLNACLSHVRVIPCHKPGSVRQICSVEKTVSIRVVKHVWTEWIICMGTMLKLIQGI